MGRGAVLYFARAGSRWTDREGGCACGGRWMLTADFTGTPIYFQLELTQEDEKLGGKFGGDKLEGSLKGNVFHFMTKDEQGCTSEMNGAVEAGIITGSVVFTDVNDSEHPETHSIKAEMVPQRPAGPPKHHDFIPTTFYRQFSPFNKPVLSVAPGDTIHTTRWMPEVWTKKE
jgi:hypothetical protein